MLLSKNKQFLLGLRTAIYVVLFLFLPISLFSQNTIIVKGVIKGEDGKRVANASVFIPEINKGTTSDKKGEFVLDMNKLLTKIIVSHINYEPKTITIDDVNSDTIQLNVILKEKINLLNSFDFRSQKTKLLYKKTIVSILDYQLYQDKLLLLLKTSKETKLSLMGHKQQVLSELILNKNVIELFKDCYGNTHLLSEDTAYQIYIDEQNISILYKYPISKFNESIKYAVAKINDKIIFINYGLHNQSIVYSYFDKNKEKVVLKLLRDNQSERYASQEIAIINYLESILERRSLGVRSRHEDPRPSYQIGREIFDRSSMYEFVLSKPSYNPLFLIGNTMYIFDHINDSCFVYDEELNEQRSIYINYHHKGNWAKEIILDKESGVFYAKFEEKGFCYLKKINLTDGKTIKTYKLGEHVYPLNIKIKNGEAFYLFKDHLNQGQMSLYKQGLY